MGPKDSAISSPSVFLVSSSSFAGDKEMPLPHLHGKDLLHGEGLRKEPRSSRMVRMNVGEEHGGDGLHSKAEKGFHEDWH